MAVNFFYCGMFMRNRKKFQIWFELNLIKSRLNKCFSNFLTWMDSNIFHYLLLYVKKGLYYSFLRCAIKLPCFLSLIFYIKGFLLGMNLTAIYEVYTLFLFVIKSTFILIFSVLLKCSFMIEVVQKVLRLIMNLRKFLILDIRKFILNDVKESFTFKRII